jgi:hypothetical protein
MNSLKFLLPMACMAFVFCQHALEPIEVPTPFNGLMTVTMKGQEYQLYIFANPNGYQDGELVLRGAATGWDRVLMLTFQLTARGPVTINQQMTGYWDLGFCTPRARYLLVADYPNHVRIENYNVRTGEVSGVFAIQVKNEDAPYDTIEFSNGRFKTHIDQNKFEYCIEG